MEILYAMARPQEPNPSIAWNDSSYSRQARRIFAPHRTHPSVALYRQAFRMGLDRSRALELAVHALSSPHIGFDKNPLFWSPWGDDHREGRRLLAKLLSALVALARLTGFVAFFAQQRACRHYEARLKAEVRAHDYGALLEDYVGINVSAPYTLFICPLVTGVTSFVDHQAPRPRISTFIGPVGWTGDQPDFGYRRRGPVVWHEWGHALFDGLEHDYAARLEAARPATPQDGFYGGSWLQCIRENVVQGLANAVLAWAMRTGRVAEGLPLVSHQLVLEAVSSRLRDFERSRRRYTTLRQFYPRIMDLFLAGPPLSLPSFSRAVSGGRK